MDNLDANKVNNLAGVVYLWRLTMATLKETKKKKRRFYNLVILIVLFIIIATGFMVHLGL